mgnify:FL=1
MILNVNRLLHTPGASQDFHFEMDLSDLEFGGEKPVVRPVVVDGRVYNQAGVLLCELQASTTLRCVCDRCAAEFDREVSYPLDVPLASELQDEENPDYFLLEGDELDLEELLETVFILNMDTRFLCRADCKGLCSRCGKNLNEGPCDCRTESDPRLAVLEQLLDDKP